ncbi:MAG: DUF2892 domain-containing protein [Gemmatimonadales bacterium]|jgi:hypothetical protein
MHTNVGRVDAWLRWAMALGFLIVAVVFNGSIALSLVAALLALVFAATALTHNCPLYTLFGFDTAHQSHPHPPHQ